MKKRIIIVEDDLIARRLITDFLTEKGYDVLSLQNGKEAIKTLKTIKPYLIIMDYILPEMNGIEVIKELRKQPNLTDTPIIFTSTFSSDYLKEEYSEINNLTYLQKPFTINDIEENINSLNII